MNKLHSALSLIFLFIFHCAYSQGLQFHGSEKNISDRSSLSIPSEDKVVHATSGYRIDVDIRNHNILSPGNIFLLRDIDSGQAFSLTFNYDPGQDRAVFIFAKNGEKTLFSTSFRKDDIQEKSLHVSLRINIKSGIIEIAIGSHVSKIALPELKLSKFAPQLNFGMNRHIVECASFSIRNLCITRDNLKTVIPLSENIGNVVHDAEGKHVGTVSNPKWLISRSFSWQPVWEFKSPTPSGFAFDPARQKLYSYSADTIRSFNILSKEVTMSPLNGDSIPVRLGMNVLDKATGNIIPYEIYYDAFFAEINPDSNDWKMLNASRPRAVWHHHAHAFRSKDRTLLLFGGYGDRAYSDKLVRYHTDKNLWDTIPLDGDKIDPRFFSSMMMTQSEDSIYLYGGKGNPEGKQDLGTKYYYDLYLIDLNSRKIKKLWEHKASEIDRVPARTLIPDHDGKHFYAITYPEYRPHSSLQLYRINIEDGTSVAVGDSIPMVSEEIATNVALYDNPLMERIYCVVQEYGKYGDTSTVVYSISSPPVESATLAAFSDFEDCNGGSKFKLWHIIVLCIAGIIGIGVVAVVKRRGQKNKNNPSIPQPAYSLGNENIGNYTDLNPVAAKEDNSSDNIAGNQEKPANQMPDTLSGINDDSALQPETPGRNTISLFGSFSVIGASGRDITYMFSKKLKLVFLYILLHTVNKNGVTSSDLSSIFWADKEPDKVKNLRNVTLNKLRKVLAEIEGISLVYEQGMFRINLADSCHCDYISIYRLTADLQDFSPGDEKSEGINTMIIRGKFLADTDDPIFDYYRQKIETYLVEYLSGAIEKYYKHGKYNMARRLCNSLLRIDPLSEHAMTYGIKACRATGRFEQAMAIYNTFSKDYHKMMGETFSKSIDEIG